MHIVAFAQQKGGAGKSTLAINLAAHWHAQGRRVLLVDLDPQGTAVTWGDVAQEVEAQSPPVIAMGDAVATQLRGIGAGYELAILDCPPRAGRRMGRALTVADVALLPCGPSPADVWALSRTLSAVEDAEGVNPRLQKFVVMNGVLASSSLADETTAALADAGVPLLETTIHARVAFARSLANGQGVASFESGGMAANEIARLAEEVECRTWGGES